MIHLQRLLRLLQRAPRGQVIVLALLLLAGSLTEGIGFILLVPLLSSLTGERQKMPSSGTCWICSRHSGFPRHLSVSSLLRRAHRRAQCASVRQGPRRADVAAPGRRSPGGLYQPLAPGRLALDHRTDTHRPHDPGAGGVNQVGNGLSAGLTLLTTLATALAYFAAAFVFSPAMAGLVLFAAAIGYVAMRRIRASALRLGSQQVDANRDLMANVQQSLRRPEADQDPGQRVTTSIFWSGRWPASGATSSGSGSRPA